MSAITTHDLRGYLKYMESQRYKYDDLDYWIMIDAIKGLLDFIEMKRPLTESKEV